MKNAKTELNIGMHIMPGNPLFEPSNPDEFVDHLKATHAAKGSKNVKVTKGVNGVHLSYTMVRKGMEVPVGAHLLYPEWGRGSFVISSEEEIRQLESVPIL